MKSLRKNFRRWWQIPRRAGDPHQDHRVTFLELFYDLVYVVLIAQLSHALSVNISFSGIGSFSITEGSNQKIVKELRENFYGMKKPMNNLVVLDFHINGTN